MWSNGAGLGSRPPSLSLIGEEADLRSADMTFRASAIHLSVDAWAAVAGFVVAMVRMQQEIDELWRDAVQGERHAESERLVEASHALRRAARVLEQDHAIG